jgi:hypothetical protein
VNSRCGYINRGHVLFEGFALSVNTADPHRQTKTQSNFTPIAHNSRLPPSAYALVHNINIAAPNHANYSSNERNLTIAGNCQKRLLCESPILAAYYQ